MPQHADWATRSEGQQDLDVAAIGVRLIDEAYFAWLFAARDSAHAFRLWSDGAAGGAAYYAYRAALDREEAAARDLHRLSQLAGGCLSALSAPA
jgi:hypothetical protein